MGTESHTDGVSLYSKEDLTLDAPQLPAAMKPFRAFAGISWLMGHGELKAASASAQRHPMCLSALLSGGSGAWAQPFLTWVVCQKRNLILDIWQIYVCA